MKLKESCVAITVALLLGMTPLFARQAPGPQTHAATGTDHLQMVSDAEIMSHPGTIAALTIKLDESFRAISDARDAKGYIKNRTALKTHEANIKALRNGLRHHTLLARNDEYQCAASGSQQNAAVECEQQMKRLVHDVGESFDTFELTNDAPDNPNSTPTMDIGPAYLAHGEALKKLADTIAQHEPTMAQAMRACF
jgi:hypothetical protein